MGSKGGRRDSRLVAFQNKCKSSNKSQKHHLQNKLYSTISEASTHYSTTVEDVQKHHAAEGPCNISILIHTHVHWLCQDSVCALNSLPQLLLISPVSSPRGVLE